MRRVRESGRGIEGEGGGGGGGKRNAIGVNNSNTKGQRDGACRGELHRRCRKWGDVPADVSAEGHAECGALVSQCGPQAATPPWA